MAEWQEHVFPHGPLVEVGPRLWYLIGRMRRGTMTRNMVVHKLPSGGLLIHSAVAVDSSTLDALLLHGQPEILVVPCRLHRMDAAVWKTRFPKMKVVAPKAAIQAASQVAAVDGAAEDLLPSLGVRCHAAAGLRPFELCYEMDSGRGKALVVTDMLFNLEDRSGFSGWLLRTMGSTGFFGITWIGRMLLLKDRTAFKGWLLAMAETPDLSAIVMAHGEPIVANCGDSLRQAAARL